MKYRLLLLLLLPALAQAGTGHTATQGQDRLLTATILAPLVLPPLLLLWACLRPQSRGLQLGLGLAMLGVLWLWGFFYRHDSAQFPVGVSVYLSSFVPLALLCNGLVQAHHAARWQACLGWAGAAIAGGATLVWRLLLVFPSLGSIKFLALSVAIYFLIGLVSWVGVLSLLRRAPALWQGPWWRTPVVVSAVGVACIVIMVVSVSYDWALISFVMACVAGLSLAAGFVALRLVSPRPAK